MGLAEIVVADLLVIDFISIFMVENRMRPLFDP